MVPVSPGHTALSRTWLELHKRHDRAGPIEDGGRYYNHRKYGHLFSHLLEFSGVEEADSDDWVGCLEYRCDVSPFSVVPLMN